MTPSKSMEEWRTLASGLAPMDRSFFVGRSGNGGFRRQPRTLLKLEGLAAVEIVWVAWCQKRTAHFRAPLDARRRYAEPTRHYDPARQAIRAMQCSRALVPHFSLLVSPCARPGLRILGGAGLTVQVAQIIDPDSTGPKPVI